MDLVNIHKQVEELANGTASCQLFNLFVYKIESDIFELIKATYFRSEQLAAFPAMVRKLIDKAVLALS
jgi:hypothetical protein